MKDDVKEQSPLLRLVKEAYAKGVKLLADDERQFFMCLAADRSGDHTDILMGLNGSGELFASTLVRVAKKHPDFRQALELAVDVLKEEDAKKTLN